MIFFKSIILAGTLVIFLSFLYAFANRNNRSIPGYLQFFYLYPLLALLVSVNAIVYNFFKYSQKVSFLVEQMYTVSDLLFWLYFFYNLLGKGSSKMKIYLFGIGIPALSCMIITYHFERPGHIGVGISNLAKCLFCLAYFYNLFHHPPIKILKREPVFWIIIGLFFNTAVTIPVYIFNDYLYNTKVEFSFFSIAMSNIAIIIMHLFFIRSHVWIARGQNVK